MATEGEGEGMRRRAPPVSSPGPAPAPALATPAVAEVQEPSLRRALILLDEFSLSAFFKELFKCYKWSLAAYPVYTKSITSATIAMLGELIASNIKARAMAARAGTGAAPSSSSSAVSATRRLGVFGLYGLLCTGPMLHYWYGLLEYILSVKMNLHGNRKTAAKLAIDRCLWGPPFVLFTISFLQLLQTLSPKATADAIRKSYVAVLIMNQAVWVPAQLCNFALVPTELQVLFVNLVNVGWNTYLSFAS